MRRAALLLTALLLIAPSLPCFAEDTTLIPSGKNSRHALIIGVGRYQSADIPALEGVKFDMDSARKMANAMAIPDRNITYLRDTEATAERIRKEIAALEARTSTGDRVFVYYSGHGTRWYDAATNRESCTEGLLAADGKVLTNQEVGKQLTKIAGKTDKLIVFYDACFSGGVASAPFQTRAFNLGGTRITPKFTPVGAPEMCARPSNFRTRAIAPGGTSQAGLPENVVHIAASRPDEVSFDNPKGGGFATVAFRDCMLGAAKDLDGSGAITVSELTACAQQKIDTGLANQPGIDGQNMTIAGNRSFVPASMSATFTQLAMIPQPAVPASLPDIGNKPPAVALASLQEPATAALPQPQRPQAPAETQTPPTTPAPAAMQPPAATSPHPTATPAMMLAEIHQQRDGARNLTVSGATRLRIERDKFDLSVTPQQDGYLYVALAGSDNQSLYLLYPNELDKENRARKGLTVRLPRNDWEITAGGPPGTNTLLVMLTDSPRDLSQLKGEAAGPFTRTLLDAQGRARLQWLLTNSATAGSAECGGAERLRNLVVTRKCSDAFASMLLKVEEVR